MRGTSEPPKGSPRPSGRGGGQNGRLYIFGSYLKGGYIAASDVDVLLEVPDNVDRLQVLHEARRLVKNRRIELHVLNHSDAEEFKKIIKEYKEIR
uniref:Nucleotidyltransferase domain-containing protein n=1 Tax=Fervidicoccus fontis TaxID=683846 RepID=A0A7C1II02_9CREN